MQIVQTPYIFLADLIAHIENARQSVYIQSMNLESGEVMQKLGDALLRAAKRKVKVYINCDWVAQKYVHGTLPILPVVNKKQRVYGKHLHARNERMYQQFVQAGIQLTHTNRPFPPFTALPFMGRSHIKMYIVDEKVAWIGGVNLFDAAFENIDFMAKLDNSQLITALVQQFMHVNEKKALQDYVTECGKFYALYVDVGKKRESIIYAKACSLIRNAKKSIVLMSQFVPDGKLLQELLHAADKGITVTIITSFLQSKVFTRYPQRASYLYFRAVIRKQPRIRLIHRDKIVHAKLLFVDADTAFFGSHNLTYSGVMFGTEEVMVETTDKVVMQQLNTFISEQAI